MGGGDGGQLDLRRAEHLLDLGRADQALAMLAPLLATSPEDPAVLCLCARAYLDTGQAANAWQTASRAVVAAPDNASALRLLALAQSRTSNRTRAVDTAARAIAVEPDAWQNHYVLAVVGAAERTTRERAWVSADRAVALAPTEPQAHLARSTVALAAGRLDVAERSARDALRLAPDDPGARHQLAAVLAAGGDVSASAEHLAAAARSDPSGTFAPHALSRLPWTAVRYLQVCGLYLIAWSSLWAFGLGGSITDSGLVFVVGFISAVFAVRIGQLLWGPAMRHAVSVAVRGDRPFVVGVGWVLLVPAGCVAVWACPSADWRQWLWLATFVVFLGNLVYCRRQLAPSERG